MFTIRKTFKFEMAHQLFSCYSIDCKNAIHGHGYLLELFLKSDVLNDDGMVLDFTHVKDILGEYINSWDHCLVMYNQWSKEYLDMLQKYNKKMKIVDYNPTAENMAKDMYKTINDILRYALVNEKLPTMKPGESFSPAVTVSKVRLHETTTGWAEYNED